MNSIHAHDFTHPAFTDQTARLLALMRAQAAELGILADAQALAPAAWAHTLALHDRLILGTDLAPAYHAQAGVLLNEWAEHVTGVYTMLTAALFPSFTGFSASYADEAWPPVVVFTGACAPVVRALASYIAPVVAELALGRVVNPAWDAAAYAAALGDAVLVLLDAPEPARASLSSALAARVQAWAAHPVKTAAFAPPVGWAETWALGLRAARTQASVPQPEPAQPEPARPEPALPGPAQPRPILPEPALPEPAQPTPPPIDALAQPPVLPGAARSPAYPAAEPAAAPNTQARAAESTPTRTTGTQPRTRLPLPGARREPDRPPADPSPDQEPRDRR
jgi:hypothetical protein